MGVFSIIQKHKMHHSNIYSGAPMPYMQRITWSGVAMHPACCRAIRPRTAASACRWRSPQKMWDWTRMGARVVITPGEITPAAFSHPLLVTQKAVPVASDAPAVHAPLGVKSDKGADAKPDIKSDIKPAAKLDDSADANLELRSTVGHAVLTQTADASGAMPVHAAVTMSDASPAASSEAPAVKTAETQAKAEAPKSDEAKPVTAAVESEQAPAKSIDTTASDEKPAETTAADASTATAEASAKPRKTAEPRTETAAETKTEATVEATAEIRKPEAATVEAAKTEIAKPEIAKPETAKAEPAKADEPKAADKPAETKAADAPADVKKDPSRLPGVATKELKREGQVAVLISRKDGKLYVRQNFKPVFDVPVTIAPSERLLGTHVFTAVIDKDNPNLLRWSVVSMPVTARNAQQSEVDERASRRRKVAGVAPQWKQSRCRCRTARPRRWTASRCRRKRWRVSPRRSPPAAPSSCPTKASTRAAKPAKVPISSSSCGSGVGLAAGLDHSRHEQAHSLDRAA